MTHPLIERRSWSRWFHDDVESKRTPPQRQAGFVVDHDARYQTPEWKGERT